MNSCSWSYCFRSLVYGSNLTKLCLPHRKQKKNGYSSFFHSDYFLYFLFSNFDFKMRLSADISLWHLPTNCNQTQTTWKINKIYFHRSAESVEQLAEVNDEKKKVCGIEMGSAFLFVDVFSIFICSSFQSWSMSLRCKNVKRRHELRQRFADSINKLIWIFLLLLFLLLSEWLNFEQAK